MSAEQPVKLASKKSALPKMSDQCRMYLTNALRAVVVLLLLFRGFPHPSNPVLKLYFELNMRGILPYRLAHYTPYIFPVFEIMIILIIARIFGVTLFSGGASPRGDIGVFSGILSKEQIVDHWPSHLIPGSESDAEAIFNATEERIAASGAPDIRIEHKNVASGFVQSIAGEKRPFLIVSNVGNRHLRPYRMYVSIRQYGVFIQVSWYLVRRATLAQRLYGALAYLPLLGNFVVPLNVIARLGYGKGNTGALGLDLFNEQDLSAYVTVVHQAFKDVLGEFMDSRKLDKAKIERPTSGVLGIS